MVPTAWLDSVLTVPAVGILTQVWLGFPTGIWTALERCSPKWNDGGSAQPLVRLNGPADIRIEWTNGLYLALTPTSVVAGSSFNLTWEQKPGTLPQVVAPTPKPYSELQSRAVDVLETFFNVGLPATVEHQLVRVGILADSRLIESVAPPGVVRFMADLELASRGRLTTAEGSLLAELRTGDDGRDQCHHTYAKNVHERPDDLGLRLDWQRVWEPAKRMRSTRILDEIRAAATLANRYFEQFGSGEVSDGDAG